MKKLKLISILLVLSLLISFFPSCIEPEDVANSTNGSEDPPPSPETGDIANGVYVAEIDGNAYLVIENTKMTKYIYGVEKVYTYEVDGNKILLTDEDGECKEYDFSFYESSGVISVSSVKYKKQSEKPDAYNIKGSFYMESNPAVQVSFDDEKMTYTKADGTIVTFYFQITMKSNMDKFPWAFLYATKDATVYSRLLRVEFVDDDMILHYSYYDEKADEKFIRK